MNYTILWGHSGSWGTTWTTAREAARYAAEVWGTVDAESPEDAVGVVEAAMEMYVDSWWLEPDTCNVHIVLE